MTSSPYNLKKARASLTCNISNFFEIEDNLQIEKSEDAEKNIGMESFCSQSEKVLESPNINEKPLKLTNLTPNFIENDSFMNQIPLFNIYESQTEKQTTFKFSPRTNFREKPAFIIGKLPQQFYFSKCFQTFDIHNSEDIALCNLYDTIKIMKISDQKVSISRLLSSENFLNAIALGKIRLDGYFVTSDFSSQVSIYDIEGKKRLRNYSIAKPTKSFASNMKQDQMSLFCGFSNGILRGFDLRMKTNNSFLSDDFYSQVCNKKNQSAFNPITSLDIRDNYLLSTSVNKLCLWDLRKGLVVQKIAGTFDEGVLKGIFSPINENLCYLGCQREKTLKVVDLVNGDIQTLYTGKNLIWDFGFSSELNKLLILSERENIVEKSLLCNPEQEKILNKAEELSEDAFSKEINICTLKMDNHIACTNRVELSKNFERLLINQMETKAWIFGIYFNILKF